MPAADRLVNSSICYASAFECYRVGDVHSLYRRPFECPQSQRNPAKGAVRSGMHLSTEACFRQAASYNLRALRSPASWYLNQGSIL
jgi:hypothetical protein